MSKLKPKDIETKHTAGDFIYVRGKGKPTNQYTIRRLKVKEVIISVKESTVDVHYDTGSDLYPEDEIFSDVVEAEVHIIAELAAYRLKGEKNDPEKKTKPKKKKPGKKRKYPHHAEYDDDDDDNDDDDIF